MKQSYDQHLDSVSKCTCTLVDITVLLAVLYTYKHCFYFMLNKERESRYHGDGDNCLVSNREGLGTSL